jgi:hypothetical protein
MPGKPEFEASMIIAVRLTVVYAGSKQRPAR